jgi:hypothetical protein
VRPSETAPIPHKPKLGKGSGYQIAWFFIIQRKAVFLQEGNQIPVVSFLTLGTAFCNSTLQILHLRPCGYTGWDAGSDLPGSGILKICSREMHGSLTQI